MEIKWAAYQRILQRFGILAARGRPWVRDLKPRQCVLEHRQGRGRHVTAGASAAAIPQTNLTACGRDLSQRARRVRQAAGGQHDASCGRKQNFPAEPVNPVRVTIGAQVGEAVHAAPHAKGFVFVLHCGRAFFQLVARRFHTND